MEYRLRRHDGAATAGSSIAARPATCPTEPSPATSARASTSPSAGSWRSICASAVKVRDEFLSIASHELRTPLTSLKLRAERLYQQVAKPTATAPLDARASSATRAWR